MLRSGEHLRYRGLDVAVSLRKEEHADGDMRANSPHFICFEYTKQTSEMWDKSINLGRTGAWTAAQMHSETVVIIGVGV